jgi:hypothetical protein
MLSPKSRNQTKECLACGQYANMAKKLYMNPESAALSQVDTHSTAAGSFRHQMLDFLEPRANPYYFEDSQSIFKSDPHDDANSKEIFYIESSVKGRTLDPWMRSYHGFLEFSVE